MVRKLLILNFVVMFIFNLAHPVTPAMLDMKGSPEFLNGMLLSMMSLAMFVSSPKFGELADKIGPKKLLIYSPLFYGVMQVGFVVFDSTVIMLTFRFLSGIAAGAWTIGTLVYINNKATTSEKTKFFGLLIVVNSLGGVVGQLFSGQIGAQGYIYLPFYLQAVLGLVAAVVINYSLDDVNLANSINKEKSSISKINNLIKVNKSYTIFVLMLIYVTAFAVYSSNIGYLVMDLFDFGTQGVANVNSYTNLLVLVANIFIVVKIEKIFGIIKSLHLLGIISLVAIVLVFIMPDKIIIVLGISVFLIFMSIVRPLVTKFVSITFKEDASVMLGVVNSVNSLGVIIGGTVSGILYSFNPYYPIILILLLLIVSFVIIIVSKYVRV